MDAALVDDFENFVGARIVEIQANMEDGSEHQCQQAYLQGFRDALKILAGG